MASVACLEHLAVNLHPGDAEPGRSGRIDRALPQPQLLGTQAITRAGLGAIDHPVADRPDDIGLAARDPAGRVERGQPVARVDRSCLSHIMPPVDAERRYGTEGAWLRHDEQT